MQWSSSARVKNYYVKKANVGLMPDHCQGCAKVNPKEGFAFTRYCFR